MNETINLIKIGFNSWHRRASSRRCPSHHGVSSYGCGCWGSQLRWDEVAERGKFFPRVIHSLLLSEGMYVVGNCLDYLMFHFRTKPKYLGWFAAKYK